MSRLILAACLVTLAVTPAAMAAKDTPAQDTRTMAQLAKAIGDVVPFRRMKAAKALAARGDAALPTVLRALKHKRWQTRRGATDALAEMGPAAKKAIPALIETLKDDDTWVRDGAVLALAKVAPGVPAAIKPVAAMLKDPDPWLRESAMPTLHALTKEKTILLPAAVDCLGFPDTTWRARGYALDIIAKYGKDYKPAIPAVVNVLERPSQGMWNAIPKCVAVLKAMSAGEKAVKPLIKLLDDESRTHRGNGAAGLATLGALAEPALPRLRDMAARDPGKGVPAKAKKAVEAIEKAVETAREAKIIDALKSLVNEKDLMDLEWRPTGKNRFEVVIPRGAAEPGKTEAKVETK